MTFVVTEACFHCKDLSCVSPCPVECFHEADNYVVINPDICIDCNVCVTECPVNAIYQDKDLPREHSHFLAFNREQSRVLPAIGTPR